MYHFLVYHINPTIETWIPAACPSPIARDISPCHDCKPPLVKRRRGSNVHTPLCIPHTFCPAWRSILLLTYHFCSELRHTHAKMVCHFEPCSSNLPCGYYRPDVGDTQGFHLSHSSSQSVRNSLSGVPTTWAMMIFIVREGGG